MTTVQIALSVLALWSLWIEYRVPRQKHQETESVG